MSAFQHIFYHVKTYLYDINNFIGWEKKEIVNLNLSVFFAKDVSDSPEIKLPSLTRVFYLTCEILFNLGWVPDFVSPHLPFLSLTLLRSPQQPDRATHKCKWSQKPWPSALEQGKVYRSLCKLQGEGWNLTHLSHHIWDVVHCPSERRVAPCGMKCGLDSSSLLFLFGRWFSKLGVKQGRFTGGAAEVDALC